MQKKIACMFSLGIWVLICLGSCEPGNTAREKQLYAYLTNSSKYILLPPEGIENAIDMTQQISASYKGRDFFFNALVIADESGIDITILNELGANLGDLSYRNGEVSFSSPIFPKSLKPEYIVADFQICFYNAFLLQQSLEDCGLFFECTENSRRVIQGKTIIIEIEKSSGSVRLVNYLREYSYTLEGTFK